MVVPGRGESATLVRLGIAFLVTTLAGDGLQLVVTFAKQATGGASLPTGFRALRWSRL